MGGYQADIDAIIYAGHGFKKVAEEYKSYATSGSLAKPPTGDPHTDETLGTVLDMIYLVHGALADAVWQHGEKLQLVAENYQAADDESIASIMQAAVTASTLRTDLPNFSALTGPKG
ncbi:DUF6317 family protein [Actinomadura sp.]|uniref:DUF6317 family protein n=1 Tax=Actinomadura sp. TaxID=1989 RepID=UPI0037C4F686